MEYAKTELRIFIQKLEDKINALDLEQDNGVDNEQEILLIQTVIEAQWKIYKGLFT